MPAVTPSNPETDTGAPPRAAVATAWLNAVFAPLFKGGSALCLAALLTAASAQAALDIDMTVDGSSVVDVGQFRGINISYTWSSLTQNLSNGQIVVDLPASLDTDSTSDVQVYGSAHTTTTVYDPSTRKITFTFVNPLPAGSSGTVQYFVRFPTSAADGTLAAINATSSGTGQPNGTDSVTLEANVNSSTNIVIYKSADKYPMLSQDVTYTLRLENNGTTNMLSPVIVDQLPAGTTYVSSDNSGSYNSTTQQVTWSLATLNAGNAREVRVTVRYNSPTFSVGQWVNNTVTATGTDSLGAPVNVSNNTSVQIVAPSPGANADKWDSVDPISLKGNFQYMFWVRNSGNVPLTNYSFTDDFPKEFIPTIIYPGSDNSGVHSSTINVWYKTTTNSTWRLVPGSPFNNAPGDDPAVYTSSLGLAVNEIVSSVKYEFGDLPVGYDASWRPRVQGSMGNITTGLDRDGVAITGLPKTVSNTYNIAYTYSGTNYTASDTETTELMGVSPVPYLVVYDPTPTSYIPLQEIKWTFRMENDWSGSEDLINPVYGTLLPASLEFVPGSVVMIEGPLPAPSVTVTNNYNGTGRQLVKFAFTGNQPPEWVEVGGTSDDWVIYMDFKTRVKSGSAAGADEIEYHLLSSANAVVNNVYAQTMRTDTNDLDGDGNITEKFITSNGGDYSISMSTAIDSVLWVKGELDSAFNRYPDAGFSRPGGSMQYKLIVTNPGNIPLTGIRVMDILPHVGDVGVILYNQSRGSNFDLALASTVTAPPGITVKYSASTNPVRTDLDSTLTSPAGAQSGTFSTTAPSPLSNTKSLLFDFGSLVLNPGESKEIVWNMTVPAGAAAGQVAWNSFGHRSQSAATGTPLPPSEPIKTGIAVPFTVGSFVWNDLDSDGTQDAGEPGIPGATLQIFRSNGTPALDVLGGTVPSVTTDANGVYAFSALADGDYFVRVTVPSQYIPTNNQVPDPDNDVDTDSNIDLSRTPPAGSYESGIFTFTGNSEPIIENGTGGTQDDVDDNNGNMTVDFGFRVIPNDFGDYSGFPDASSTMSATIKLGTAVTDAELVSTTNATATGDDNTGTDDEDGVTFGTLGQGQTATVTVSRTNTSGAVVYLNAWVDFNNNGSVSAGGEQILSDVLIPDGTSGSQSYTFSVPSNATTGSAAARFRITSTSNPGPTGASGNGEVEDVIVSIQPGLSIGNLIWNDVNNNGAKDAAEVGLSGALVQLFNPGADNAIGGSGANADTQVGSNYTTTVTGGYGFSSLPPGKYYVKVTPPAGYITGGTPATTDNNVNNNNDGSQSGGVGTALFSPVIDLAAGAESTTDGDADANTNLTVDFGLFAGIQVGNLVWNDSNGNGTYESATESGISGVTVELLDGSGNPFSPTITTTTNASGVYGFTVYAPGNYRIRVTPNVTQVLASSTVGSDNATDNNNDGTQAGAPGSVSRSFAFTLTAAGEPGTSGTSNTENTIDFGLHGAIYDYSDHASLAEASSLVTAGTLRIGATADTELAATKNSSATGDDNTGSDDEDGVIFPVSFNQGSSATVTVTVLNNTGASAYLNAWMDFNRDGIMNDTLVTSGGERLTAEITVPTGATATTQNITFTVPTSSSVGYYHPLRVRLTSVSSPGYDGKDGSGEVEDYHVLVCSKSGFSYGTSVGSIYEIDMSDGSTRFAIGLPSGFSKANGLAYAADRGTKGVLICATGAYGDLRLAAWDRATGAVNVMGDLASFGFPSGAAIRGADYWNGFYYAMENGTDNLWKIGVSGSSGAYVITSAVKVSDLFSNSRGHNYGDFVITPTGTLYSIAANTSGGTTEYFTANLNVATPVANMLATPTVFQNGITLGVDGLLYGGLGVLSNNQSWYEIDLLSGNVLRTISSATVGGMTDLTIGSCDPAPVLGGGSLVETGDHSGVGAASSVPTNGLIIGALQDGENTATTNAAATGDDTNGVDDEEGATLPAALYQSTTATMQVTVFNDSEIEAYLNAWVDLNGDGVFNDSLVTAGGEKITPQIFVPWDGVPVTHTITFAVPSNASLGTNRAVRFRLTNVSNPGPLGADGSGEVEDYGITILPSVTIGNLVWEDFNHNGVKDGAENGLAGATVQLFDPGTNEAIGGGGSAADTQVGASFVTTSSGAYSFVGLTPGKYFIKVTPPAGYVTGGTPATADNNVNNNNDGSQPGGVGTALFSPIIDLASQGESITDGDTDPNTNLTVDFGLFAGIQLGSHVWHDVNDNGLKDGGEAAISGLQVELLNGSTNAVLATTTTNGSGQYAFTVYTAGNYKVSVTPNTTLSLASTTYVTADNAVDNDNNGYQPGIKGTASASGTITLTPAGEPGSSGSTNVENTIDFGFRPCPTVIVTSAPASPDVAVMRRAYSMQMSASGGIAPHAFSVTAGSLPPGLVLYPNGLISGTPSATGTYTATITASDVKTCTGQMSVQIEVLPPLSIGNLVFQDLNSDGNADTGEGVSGVTVQLYTSTQTPGTDTPVAVLTTGADGGYLFEGLYPGLYRVHVPAAMFATGAPLASMISITEGLTGDDDAGEDGINSLTPQTSGISTGVISLTVGTAPTDQNGETGFDAASDNDYDAAINLTIDLGFANPLGVGNMVFNDADGDGKYDSGEGVGAVTVRLYRAGDTPGVSSPVAEMETDSAGRYFFDYLMGGDFFVFIPAAEFASGGQLQGKLSVSGAGTGALDDNADENGLDGMSPQSDGVRSNTFTLANNTEPTNAGGETGYLNSEDSRDDNNYDLTIDLGFAEPNPTKVGIGNLVFLDDNGNGIFDSGEGVAGVTVRLFDSTANVQTGTPLATAVTGSGGIYSFANLNAGSYIVHIPASEFAAGRPLHGKMSLIGNGGDNGYDDDMDENGVDAANLALSGISSVVITLATGAEPRDNTTEFGEGFYMDVVDANADLTVDFGFFAAAGVGNLVFRDLNENGHSDVGEGVAGVKVELYQEGYYPLFDTPYAATTTSSDGKYRFENLPPGNYFLWLPSSEFGIGKPLYQAVSVDGVQTGDDNAGEDGVDEAQPVIFGVSSTVFTLSSSSSPAGTAEPGIGGSDDDSTDTAVDMTIDLGFTQPAPRNVSGQVRNDLDRDGDFLDNDSPLQNIEMSLYYDANQDYALDELDVLVATTTTGANGSYTFTGVTDGGYLIVETDPPGVLSTNDTYDLNDNLIHVVVNGAHVTGNDFLDAIDPQGHIYDPTSGNLVTGGTVSVTGPGTVTILMDGSTGTYAWVKDSASSGDYTLNYTPPAGRQLDASRPAQLIALDPTGQSSPYPIGSALAPSGIQLSNFSAAANPWFNTYSLVPGDPLTTRNNIPVVLMSAGTWMGWQYYNTLGGQNGPTQNPDGDVYDNLFEFAFNLNPSSGVNGGVWPLQMVHNKVAGTIDVKVRRVTGLSGAVMKLQGIADLASSPSGWFDITTITPTVTANGDGSETLLYSNMAQIAALSGGRGFVRVHLALDADGNGSHEITAKTGVCGWASRAFTQSLETAASPFVNAPVFTGAVTSVSGLTFNLSNSIGGGNLVGSFTAGKQYFIEVTSGDHVGQRVDVDESTSTTSGTLTVDAASALNTITVGTALPATFAADKIIIREHQTIGGVFDRTIFAHTNSPATADRMLFFNRATNTYTTYWLYRNLGNPKWVRNGDGTLADAGTRVLAPGEGLFVNPRAAAVTVTFTGEVRANAFACPLGVGTQLVANPWPSDCSPSQRGMSTSTGFRGTSSAGTADQIRLWLGDTTTGQQGYTTYYYFKFLLFDQWTRQGDALLGNQNSTALFKSTKSVFIRSVLGNGPWVMTCPWTP